MNPHTIKIKRKSKKYNMFTNNHDNDYSFSEEKLLNNDNSSNEYSSEDECQNIDNISTIQTTCNTYNRLLHNDVFTLEQFNNLSSIHQRLHNDNKDVADVISILYDTIVNLSNELRNIGSTNKKSSRKKLQITCI